MSTGNASDSSAVLKRALTTIDQLQKKLSAADLAQTRAGRDHRYGLPFPRWRRQPRQPVGGPGQGGGCGHRGAGLALGRKQVLRSRSGCDRQVLHEMGGLHRRRRPVRRCVLRHHAARGDKSRSAAAPASRAVLAGARGGRHRAVRRRQHETGVYVGHAGLDYMQILPRNMVEENALLRLRRIAQHRRRSHLLFPRRTGAEHLPGHGLLVLDGGHPPRL